MRYILNFFIFLIACGMTIPVSARTEGIAATINSDVVTWSDVEDRMRLIMESSGLPDRPDVVSKVRGQVLMALVEEKIKQQEAERQKIIVSQSDIDAAIAEVAAQNKMKADEFKNMLTGRGIKIKSLEGQIRAQVAWMQIVARVIRPRIEISETDIDVELDRLRAHIGEKQWLLSEIVLPAETSEQETESKMLAIKMITQIKEAPQTFPALARQFSRAAGAQMGGDLGWILAAQIPSEFEGPLKDARQGAIIGPWKTQAGMHILFVRDIRTATEENIPNRDSVRNALGIQRLDRAQKQYLIDIRSSAFIEIRDVK